MRDDVIQGLGLSIGEMRSVARRQLAGSITVACIIAAAVALTSMRPAQPEAHTASAQRIPTVSQPIFVTPSEHVASLKNRPVELP